MARPHGSQTLCRDPSCAHGSPQPEVTLGALAASSGPPTRGADPRKMLPPGRGGLGEGCFCS